MARAKEFFVAGATFKRVVLGGFANSIVSAAGSGDKVEILSKAWRILTCDEK